MPRSGDFRCGICHTPELAEIQGFSPFGTLGGRETVLCAAATGLARLFPHADDTLSVYAFCLPHAALGADR